VLLNQKIKNKIDNGLLHCTLDKASSSRPL
uniref:Uncharacterized protein n=1 Tax=Aegilops tauschii subsp. strangulata TaxID=200361 RepID=A0A453BFU1_AEGTS